MSKSNKSIVVTENDGRKFRAGKTQLPNGQYRISYFETESDTTAQRNTEVERTEGLSVYDNAIQIKSVTRSNSQVSGGEYVRIGKNTFALVTANLPMSDETRFDRITTAILRVKEKASTTSVEIYVYEAEYNYGVYTKGERIDALLVESAFDAHTTRWCNLIKVMAGCPYKNNSVILDFESVPASVNDYVDIFTETANSNLNKPQLTADFIPTEKAKRYVSSTSGSAGAAGEYSVNNLSGRLNFSKNLFTLSGNKMPLKVTLAYNGEAAMDGSQSPYNQPGMPYGWRLNYAQKAYYDDYEGKYIYIDAKYDRHIFELSTYDGFYYDTSGTGLSLIEGEDGCRITDDKLTTLVFDGDGRLTHIRTQTGLNTYIETQIVYVGDYLTQVIDGNGRYADIAYDTTARTITITKPDTNTVVIRYDADGTLSEVTNEDGDDMTYTYDNSGLLLTAISPLGDKITVTYIPESKWVSAVTESVIKTSGNETTDSFLRSYDFIYGCHETTVEKREFLARNYRKPIIFNYVFADNGDFCTEYETIRSYDEEGVLLSEDIGYLYSRMREDFEEFKYCGSLPKVAEATFINNSNHEVRSIVLHFDTGSETHIDSNLLDVSEMEAGKYYVMVGEVRILWGSVNESDEYYKIELIKQSNVVLATAKVSRSKVNKQIVAARFKYNGENNLFVRPSINIPGSAVVFDNIRIVEDANAATFTCIDVMPTAGATPFYTDKTGKQWYKLQKIGLRLSGQEDMYVRFTFEDLIANMIKCSKEENFYNIWYDGLKCMGISEYNIASVLINGQEYGFDEFLFCSLQMNAIENTIEVITLDADNCLQIKRAKERTLPDATIERHVSYSYLNEYYQKTKDILEDGTTIEYEYNEYGELSTQNSFEEPDIGIRYFKTFTTDGNYIQSEGSHLEGGLIDKTYSHDDTTGNLVSLRQGDGATTQYDYATNNIDMTEISATVGAYLNKNEMNYVKGRLESLTHNGFTYYYTYDNLNRLQTIETGSTVLIRKEYEHRNDSDFVKTTYANGYIKIDQYDIYGRLIGIFENTPNIRLKSYLYCDYTPLSIEIDPLSDTLTVNAGSKLRKTVDGNEVIIYEYNAAGDLISSKMTKGNSTKETTDCYYDYEGRLTKRIYRFGSSQSSDRYTFDYSYRNDDKIKRIDITNNDIRWYTETRSNALEKLLSKVSGVNGSTVSYDYTYYQRKDSIGRVIGGTDFVKTIKQTVVKSGSPKFIDAGRDTFTYDSRGNITSVTRAMGTNSELTRYTYDGLSRLVREDNEKLGKTYVFEYDAGGNILTKKEYAYTIGTPTGVPKTYNYVYDNVWKDKMTSFDGEACSYDAGGNPTTYRGKTVTWTKGRRLASLNYTNSFLIYYTYDREGRLVHIYRVDPTMSTDRDYYWDGNKIIREQVFMDYIDAYEETFVDYVYSDGEAIGMKVDGTPYFYLKNVLGDVIAIYDALGNLQCRYVYDAWGNHKIYSASGVEIHYGVGAINSIRYRGYFYESGTGLYYLNTRYYDPETGRFINADDLSYLDPATLNGLKLFAYCNNNPVMNVDPEGTSLFGILFSPLSAIVGLLFQAAVSVVAYAAFAVASIFDEEIRNDMNDIGWNPFNKDEEATINSNKVSFYKGVPVIRADVKRSGTFGIMLLQRFELDKNTKEIIDINYARRTLTHEWGHVPQQLLLGPAKFLLGIGVPSMLSKGTNYYKYPWEAGADIFGGVTGRGTKGADNRQKSLANLYLAMLFFI